jgi:alpha-1,2-mannosyltransferase
LRALANHNKEAKSSGKVSQDIKIVVYCTSKHSSKFILDKISKRFGIDFEEGDVHFVSHSSGNMLRPENYPRFTIFWQALAQIYCALEAYRQFPCDMMVESIGAAYAYLPLKLIYNPKLVSYTHYPQVSQDMIEVVASGVSQYNNSDEVANSFLKRQLKRVYYQVMVVFYSVFGRFADLTFANSTWTYNHLRALWGTSIRASILYPPCDIEEFGEAKKVRGEKNRNAENVVLSFAQFRPEKQQDLQLKVFKRSLPKLPKDAKLWLIGSVRGEDDERIIANLKQMAKEL